MNGNDTMLAAVDLAFGAATDPGLVRRANEDSLLAERPVFLVADGMGGYEAGDRASSAVVDAFRQRLCTGSPASLTSVRDALGEAERLVAAVAATTSRGTGSTVSGVVLLSHADAPHWLILNVGDSRVYRQVGVDLEQLTVDHSLAQEMVDAGRLAPDDQRTYEHRNIITRAIGAPDSRPDSWIMPVTTGERLLICSDGLHGEIGDEEIRATLAMTGHPRAAAAALVDAAKRAGGHDNITAIVIDVRAGGVSADPDAGLSTSMRVSGARADEGARGGATADRCAIDDGDTVPM